MPCVGHAEPSGTGSAVSIMSDSIQVAGDMLNALANHLGISELSCVSEFPSEIALARNVLTEAAEGRSLASRMQTDVAEVTGSIKSLVRSFTLQDVFYRCGFLGYASSETMHRCVLVVGMKTQNGMAGMPPSWNEVCYCACSSHHG